MVVSRFMAYEATSTTARTINGRLDTVSCSNVDMVNIVPHIVGTVNMPSRPSAPRPYHHGDLKNAMVDAAVATARRQGPDAGVIRDSARQVGASPHAADPHVAA